MRLVKIKDIGTVVSGSTPKTNVPEYWGGEIAWATPKDLSLLDGQYLYDTAKKITQLGYDSCSTSLLPKDSVLFSSRAPIGLVAINKIPVCTNQGFKSIIPNKEVSSLYLYYALKYFSKTLERLGNGATFKELSKKTFEEFALPLPDISDQIRIADILSKAELLIRQRKESLRLLDEFLKSTFLEMFGDRKHTNVKEYLIDELKQGGSDTFSNGPFGSNLLTSELTNDGVPVIYIRDIRHGEFSWRSNVYVTKEKADSLRSCQVKEGDVLIAKVGDPPGISAVYPKGAGTAIITQDVIRLRLNTSFILPEYFTHYLNSSLGKQLIKRISIEGTRNRFPLGAFKTLAIPVPALDKQIHFQRLAENVQVVKKHAQESLSQLCNLYASLSQKAFKGELQVTNK